MMEQVSSGPDGHARLDEFFELFDAPGEDAHVGVRRAVVEASEAVTEQVGLIERGIESVGQSVHAHKERLRWGWLPVLAEAHHHHRFQRLDSRGMSLTHARREP